MNNETYKWEPITQEMLSQFESDGSGYCVLKTLSGYKSVGEYEWRQGLHPHGFLDDDDRWTSANRFIEIMRNI